MNKIIMILLCCALAVGFWFSSYKVNNDLNVTIETIKTLTADNDNLKNRLSELKAVRTESKTDIKEYILTYYKTVAPVVADEISKQILIASKKHDVPFVTIVAVVEVESQFNPAAISKAKARGLMQVMPKFWMNELNLKSKYAFHDIQTGIDSGAYILRKYLNNTNNNMKKTLYKYVGGDHSYVRKVYESMGKFVVYRSFANMTVQDTLEQTVSKTVIPTTFIHTVTYKGETLSLISKWYTGKVSNWKEVAKSNKHIIPEAMPIGAKIIIPTTLLQTTVKLTKKYIKGENNE